ncbi:cell wall-binding repeat-containing protein [Clostridium autoethanogenum]|uniref:Cell wall-binding repeat-containing protein n=1 Tax=Clostridium autoethanogenum TaxID=84023 RepID=A0A3M0T2N7_9CLOT|nr:cell wall-binding repeat-containing protein [Clostridium autoethanogenum]RMD04192.1 cell wall-binding repeat-containing protein [Clostridium autoethanogenum]
MDCTKSTVSRQQKIDFFTLMRVFLFMFSAILLTFIYYNPVKASVTSDIYGSGSSYYGSPMAITKASNGDMYCAFAVQGNVKGGSGTIDYKIYKYVPSTNIWTSIVSLNSKVGLNQDSDYYDGISMLIDSSGILNIAVVENGTVLNTDNHLYCKYNKGLCFGKYNTNSGTWDGSFNAIETQALSDGSLSVTHYQYEYTKMQINASGNITLAYIKRNSNNTSDSYIVVKSGANSNSTWSQVKELPLNLSSGESVSIKYLVSDALGKFSIIYTITRSNGNDVYALAYPYDNPNQILDGSTKGCGYDIYGAVTNSAGNIYLAYTDSLNGGNGIVFNTGDDGAWVTSPIEAKDILSCNCGDLGDLVIDANDNMYFISEVYDPDSWQINGLYFYGMKAGSSQWTKGKMDIDSLNYLKDAANQYSITIYPIIPQTDKLMVHYFDNTSLSYGFITGDVNDFFPSSSSNVATVTSDSYTVSAGGTADESITNVPYGTTKADFIAALTKGESHESFDEASLHDPVVSGDKLVVTAEDGTTKVTYTVTVNPEPIAANASNNTISLDGDSIAAGGTVIITAGGDRQEEAGSVVGDERYIPSTWTSTESGKSGNFELSDDIYTSSYQSDTPGSYTITANYKKQKWNGSAWEDIAGAVDSKDVTLTVSEVTVTIGTDDLPPAGTVGVPYTQYTFTAAGGTGNKTYYVTAGNLPAGLNLSEDGVLSGTPTEAGTKTFTVTVNDDGVCEPSDSHEFTITVSPAKSTVAIVTSTSYTVSAGGKADESITNVPYGTTKADFIAAITKGESHESFDEALLHDTIVSGDKLVVMAEDGTTKVTYTITVNPAPTAANASNNTVDLSTSSITAGGTITITASGDRQEVAGSIVGDERYIPNTWTSTELGKGGSFSFNGTSYNANYVTGTVGSYTIIVTYKKQSWNGSSWVDSLGISDSKNITLTVSGVTVTIGIHDLPPAGTVGVPYTQYTFTAAGGTGNKTYYVTAGNLPAGLNLSEDGVLSGTPTEAGTKTFTVTVNDDGVCEPSDSHEFTITVNPAKSTVATVTSDSYTVSAGDTGDETITNVPNGTTKAEFIAAIAKGESHESFDEALLHDTVVSGDKLVVTAEDGTTKATYTITVNPAKSTVATVTSISYTVSAAGTADEGITNVPYGTTKAEFIAALTKGESHESFDEASLHDLVATGDKIVVTAEDGTTKVTYTVTVNAATAPEVFTVNQPTSADNGVNDDGKSSVTVTWTDSITAAVDHYEIVAKVGAAPEVSDTVAGETSIAKGIQTAAFDWTAGENLYVGVVAVDANGLKTLCSGTIENVTVEADGHTASKSTTATVTSTSYTVSAGGTSDETITNVPYGTTKAEFIAALTKGESHESFDEASLHDPVVNGDKIVVTAEDGTTKVTYTITVNSAPTAASASNNTVNLSTSNITVGGTITITAAGDRQEAAGSIVGDERYIPNTWTSTESGKGGSFSFNGTSYNVNYVTGTAGSYTITVNYKKQSWNGSSWVDVLGISDSKTENVTVNAIVPPDPTPVETTGSVVDDSGKPVQGIKAQVTTETDGTKTVAVKSQDAIVLRTPDGTVSPLADISGLSFSTTGNTNVTLSSDGTIKVKDLANGTQSKINVTLDVGNGQKIIIGTIDVKVSESGAVSITSTLIDPYGIITDSVTGKIIDGANLTLYYANTDRNKANGKTPDTVVSLPIIDDFKPNKNENPQVSDASGAYGFMVFPNTDYYITVDKEGYDKYTSPTISVGQEIVKFDVKMNKSVSSSSGGSGGSGGSSSTPANIQLERISGQNRVDTAIAIAKAAYKDKVSNVILASSGDYPDALAGSVLAHKLKAPILLVGNSMEDREKVLAYLKENMDQAGNIYILGGNCAVDPDVEEKLEVDGFKNIQRLGGKDRYETNAKINDMLAVKEGTPVIIVSGENYPDAISVSSAAAANQYPVLLVKKDEISDYVRKKISDIKPDKIYIIGLQGAVSDTVENQVVQTAGIDKSKVVRIGGTDRFQTSLNVAKYFSSNADIVCAASGNNFPDALAGSTYAANSNAPILLINTSLSNEENLFLQSLKLKEVTIFGGTGAVSKDVENDLSKITGK